MQNDPVAAEFYSLVRQHLQRVDRKYLFGVICGSVDAGIRFGKDLVSQEKETVIQLAKVLSSEFERRQRPNGTLTPHVAVRIVKRR
jgi:hypothetical protein